MKLDKMLGTIVQWWKKIFYNIKETVQSDQPYISDRSIDFALFLRFFDSILEQFRQLGVFVIFINFFGQLKDW